MVAKTSITLKSGRSWGWGVGISGGSAHMTKIDKQGSLQKIFITQDKLKFRPIFTLKTSKLSSIAEDTELPPRTNTNFLVKHIFCVDFKLKIDKRGVWNKAALGGLFSKK